MWKLGFLIATWLAQVIISSQNANESIDSDLEAEFDKIADEILSSFTFAHSPPLQRHKRDLNSDQTLSFVDETGVYRLQTITPVSRLCNPAIDSKFINVGTETYAACVSAETKVSPAEAVVGIYRDHVWSPIARWYVVRPHSISAFYFKGFIYVLVADSGKVKGTDLVKVNITSTKASIDYTVHSKHPTSLSVWKMKIEDTFHMAIANSAGHSTDFTSEVFVYNWFGTYFDIYGSIKAYDVRDIEPFNIHDTPYLAIANYRKSFNNYEVDSEILRYNLDKDKKGWISHQKITTYGATDLEFFTLGSGVSKEFFLAVANKEDNDPSNIKSTIYKFAKDLFVPFQCLPTTRVSSIASWSTKYAFLLAVASSDDAVHIFQYDGWRFVHSSSQFTQGSMSYGVNSMVFYNITKGSEGVPILSVSNPEYPTELSIFEIRLKHENDLNTWATKSTEWCFNTLQTVESTETDSIIRALDDVFYTDQVSPIVIEGNVHFKNGFEVSKLHTPKLKEIVTQEVYDNIILLKLEEIHRRLQAVDLKLQEFEEVVKNSLKVEGNQTVSGHMTFQDVVFDCGSYNCQFDSINTAFLNGEDISNWSKKLVFLDSEYIDGTLYAEMINATSVNVAGLIDGVDSKTLVTKSGTHLITGPKVFKNPISAYEVEVHGKVDGVEITPTNVLLSTGFQNVTGNYVFDEIETDWLEVTSNLNDKNLFKFYEDVVREDTPSVITGEKIFHDLVIEELKIAPESKVNGMNLADLWKNTLWKDGQQTLTAPMTFHSVRMMKNLDVHFGINEILIPGPSVVDINKFANASQYHEFTQPTKIAHLKVLNSLNGLVIQSSENNPPQLDIMLKSGNQVVTGKKTFHTIHLDSDSTVKGLVDGVDLSELKAIVLRRDSVIDTNRTWVFNNLVIKGPLTVGKISGYDLESIYENALKLTDEQIPEIVFNKVIHVEDLESDDINGVNVKRDLVLVNEPQNLTGIKQFREIVLEDNSIVVNTVNNVSVTFLNETILRIGNQVLKSKVFNKNVRMNSLIVKGSLNNIPIEEFVTLNKPETFLNAKELRNASFLEIEANNLEVFGAVNGINVDEMIKNTLTYEGKQEVSGKLIVKGNINVAQGEDLQVGYINGVNINELWEDAVLTDEPQEISGEKVFIEPVTFNNLEFKDTIDGVSEWDINNWMLKDKPQIVEADVTFVGDLFIDNLKMNGLINNISITELSASVVKTNEPFTVEGPIIFENTVISKGPVTLTGKVQGVNLSEAVTRSGDKVITSMKTFTDDLLVEGDLFVEGLVDGISISDICKNTLLFKREQNISRITIKGDVTLQGGSSVGGKISGIDLKELKERAGCGEDSINIEGHKIFSNLTIDGPVILEGKFGGVDLTELNQTYMSRTRDQDITGKMEFEEVEFHGTLTASDFSSKNNMVNGIDIKNLNDRILKNHGTQKVTAKHHFDEVIFADDVFVAGKVNGLDVPGGLMRHNKPNYIQSPKVFEKPVHVEDLDIAEGKLIQGVDVSDWYKKAVLNNGETFEVHGLKIFKNLTVTDARVEGLLDGVNISEDNLLITYGDQVITGKKTIKDDVEITGSLTLNGLVNNVDLNYLYSNTLQRDRMSTVTGEKHFTKPVTINYLDTPSIAGIDIGKLQRKVNTHLDFDLVQNRLSEIEGAITIVQEAINKQAVIFQYYELFQEFNIPKAYNWFYLNNQDCGEMLLLSENSSSGSCSTIRIYNYDKEKQLFLSTPRELLTSYATSVKSLFINGKTFLFIANQNPKTCLGEHPGSGATSDIYVWKGDDFVLFQTIQMESIVHMEVFTANETSCAIYADIRSTNLYCSSGIEENFLFKETLPTIGCRKVAVINFREKIILAVATENLRARSYFIDESPIDIYFWNSIENSFSSPVQIVPSTNVQSLLLMSHFTDHSYELFLVISMGKIPKILNEPKIVIYKYDQSSTQLVKYQVLKENGELEWIVLPSGELILLILNLPEGNVKLYELKGASGFVHVDTVKSIGTINMHTFTRSHDPEDSVNHYLALAGPYSLMARTSQGTDYAKILKSKVKGRRYFINP